MLFANALAVSFFLENTAVWTSPSHKAAASRKRSTIALVPIVANRIIFSAPSFYDDHLLRLNYWFTVTNNPNIIILLFTYWQSKFKIEMKGEYANEISKHLLSKLFISTLYLSAFTFGGGYVIVTLMKKKFVDQYHWIDDEEMLDLIAIAQSSPGAIAVNGAIVVGYKLAGIPGVLLCVLATVLPPFVIISILSVFYAAFQSNVWIRLLLEGMQSGVAAVIASVVYDMGRGIIREKHRFLF